MTLKVPVRLSRWQSASVGRMEGELDSRMVERILSIELISTCTSGRTCTSAREWPISCRVQHLGENPAIRKPKRRGILYTNAPSPGVRERVESSSAVLSFFGDNPSMFQLLFERSADAIWLFDPQAGVFMDCNSAAVELMRAGTKEKLLGARPEDLSPLLQPDGTSSREKTAQVIALV